MRARTVVVVEPRGRLATVDCQPPLTVRQVHSEDPDTCSLCLVGTAAGPLAGDELELEITLRDHARAELQAAGAGIAQGGGGTRSSTTTVTLGEHARLVARPPTLVVGGGSRVDLAVSIDLAEGASVEWHERVVLGRTGEEPGAATLRWDVTRSGRPVLRQFVDLADTGLARWRGLIDRARVVSTVLVSDPALRARTVVLTPTAVAARLDDTTSLLTVLGDSAAAARWTMDELLRAVLDGTG